jgi:hypothetical protein
MIFEYDEKKSASNKVKHGVDFEEAKEIFYRGAVVLNSRYPTEPRKLAIGPIGEKIYTAIFTERGSQIRIISCRRSRKDEVKIYEEEKAFNW